MSEIRSNPSAAADSGVVAAIFRERQALSNAIDELTYAGFANEQIHTWTGDGDEPTLTHTPRPGGQDADTGDGSNPAADDDRTVGALPATTAGTLAGVGALTGTGYMSSGGSLAGAGAGAGAAAGLAVFTGLGLTEDEARDFSGDYHKGEVVVAVHAGGRRIEAKQILERNGGRTGTATSSRAA